MDRRLGVFLLCLCLACVFGPAGCAPTPTGQNIARLPSPPFPPRATTTPTTRSVYPLVPAILPKPAWCGPLYPPVISLPARMPEPWIRVRITAELSAPPHVEPWLYRGKIDIVHLADGKYAALNVLPIEDYLAGVLSRELYRNWAPATYRAQAIAARTYALYQMETFGQSHAWDVTDTTDSQVYGGRKAETSRAWNAVRATRGEVLYCADNGLTGIFCAYYSACNGGATQSAAAAWGDYSVPTLVNKVTGTLDANCPEFSWPPMRYSKDAVTHALRHWGKINSLAYLTDLGPVVSVRITRRNPITRRPMIITVKDIYGHIGKLRAEEFRLALLTDPVASVQAPPSSFFDIQNHRSYILLVNGHGLGHGVGLSQWGAQTLALRGRSARYILSFYYPSSWIHRQW